MRDVTEELANAVVFACTPNPCGALKTQPRAYLGLSVTIPLL